MMKYSPLDLINYYRREGRFPPTDVMLTHVGIRRKHPEMPQKIQLEHTTSCNFRCITCSRETLHKTRLNRNITLDEFKALIEKIPSIKEIQMQGMGETFLNVNLPGILLYCKEKGIGLTTTTNGSLIDKHLDKIGYFKSITISVDSSEAKNFEEIRIGGKLDKTLENIGRIVEEKRKRGYKTTIGINTVVSHMNYVEIPKLVEIAISLGVDHIGFVEVANWEVPGEKDFEKDAAFIVAARKKSGEIKSLIDAERAKHPNFEIQHEGPQKVKPTCSWPFTSAFITGDGYVTPCCRRPNPDVINFGNINDTSFEKIWNSEKYVAFRENMKEGKTNPICDGCPD